MSVDLKVTFSQLSNAQSAQLAGLAVGCLFFIPFAIKYGRRPVYLLSTLILAASSWWTSRVDSYAELIATSFITGLAGAINETAVQMTVRSSLSPFDVDDNVITKAFKTRSRTCSSYTSVELPTVSTSLPSCAARS